MRFLNYFFISTFILFFSSHSIAIGGGGGVTGVGPAVKIDSAKGGCTATIIHSNVLITASHCVSEFDRPGSNYATYRYQDRSGSYREQKYIEGEVMMSVQGTRNGVDWFCHSSNSIRCERALFKFVKYAHTPGDVENDFAIVYRERAFTKNPEIAGISLYNWEGVIYRVFGAGGTLGDQYDPAMRSYLDTVDSSRELTFKSNVNDERLCEGDSGGPATVQFAGDSRYYVAGIAANKSSGLFNTHCSRRIGEHRFHRVTDQTIQWINYVLYYKLDFNRCAVDRRLRSNGSILSWWCGN